MDKKFDRFAGVAFLIVGILFLVESQRISDSAYGSSVGPKIFPMSLGIILIALSIRLLYETFKYKGEDSEKEKLQYKKFFIIFGSAILYAFFLEKIGYVLSTFLFLLIAFQTMERGKTVSSIVIAAIFSLGTYFLFSELLGGSLPGFPLF
jgi:putative tricarboxylic transport membrane protein